MKMPKINREYLVLGAIIILAAGLIFFRLTRADIQTDDAMYSLRSIGYLDFVDSEQQTTPISWFSSVPTWSKLSFHDAPPLVFIIQHLFFTILGPYTLVARLPFALAGLGCIIVLYFWARRLYDKEVAMVAAGILSVMSYHAWASRVGYLEIIALFFILLAFYFFTRAQTDSRWYLAWGVATGLAIISKYTAIGIIPICLVYVLIQRRRELFNRFFLGGIASTAILFLPIVVYNIRMFQTRGHFDVQFAKLLHQNMADWPALKGAAMSVDIVSNFRGFINIVTSVYSWPLVGVLVASILVLLVSLRQVEKRHAHLLLGLTSGVIVVELIIVGVAARFISLINPFVALIIAVAVVEVYRWAQRRQQQTRLLLIPFILVSTLVFSFELLYAINTNLAITPRGHVRLFYSPYRWESNGFNQLEKRLITQAHVNFDQPKKINKLQDLMLDFNALPRKDIFIYERNLNWFSTVWYFRRWTIYGGPAFFSDVDMLLFFKKIGVQDWFAYFKEKGIERIYYIAGQKSTNVDTSADRDMITTVGQKMEHVFQAYHANVETVYDAQGTSAFTLYSLSLK